MGYFGKYRTLILVLAGAAVSLGLITCIVTGLQREAAYSRQAFPVKTVNLKFGDLAPDFELPASNGSKVSLRDLRNSWALIIIGQNSCAACVDQINSLCEMSDEALRKIRIVLVLPQGVLVKHPKLKPVYQKAQQSGITVVFDQAKKVANRYCDAPITPPFSVLIDKAGYVRYVQSGYINDGIMDRLVEVVATAISDDRSLIVNSISGPPIPDAPLYYADGKPLDLARLSKDSMLVLTFTRPDCTLCGMRLDRLQRFKESPVGVKFVTVVPSGAVLTKEYQGAFVVEDKGRRASKAYGIKDTPTTMIIDHGRLTLKELSADPSDDILETTIGLAVLKAHVKVGRDN